MADGPLVNGNVPNIDNAPMVDGDGEVHEERPVVLKFGGTSVGKYAAEIAQICLLLKAAQHAARPDSSQEYNNIVSKLHQEHKDAANCIKSLTVIKKYHQDIAAEFEALNHFLHQISNTLPKTGSLRPEDEDQVVSVGEKLSSQLLAALLKDRGIPSQYVDLSDVINFPVPDRLSQTFYRDLSASFRDLIATSGERVPVITGFFGRIPGGLVNSLGRGYSDLCAALVAVALQASELQVWKEVDGVFTADPRKVPTACLLPTLTPDEAGELTFYGSEVIHNFTLQQCIPRIPIRIKNVLRPHNAGTIIQAEASTAGKSDPYKHLRPKRPTAVTVKQQITVVNVHSNRKVDSPSFLAQICTILARNSLAVDLFEKNECHVSLAVHSKSSLLSTTHSGENKYQIENTDLINAVRELEEYGVVDVVHGMAILSLIGTGLKRSIGIAGKLFTALGDNNVNIEMISQGMSAFCS
ncbi:MAG: hypothetical protein Q9211_006047 [Gyalolechia sp. 1 TL-2023]